MDLRIMPKICEICLAEKRPLRKEAKYYVELHGGTAAYLVCIDHLNMLKSKRALSFMQNWKDAERNLIEWQAKSKNYLPVKH